MKTALFVALAMAHGTTASDQSRVATELDEDLTPEEQVPGGASPLPADVADLFKNAFSQEVADLLFGSTPAVVTTASVAAAFADAGYTVGATKTGVVVPGIAQISFVVKTLPTIAAAAGGLDQSVTMKMEADTAQIESNSGDYKLALGLTLAKDLKVLYSQLSALLLTFVSPTTGQSVTVGREAKALTTGDVDVAFNICANAGCLGTSAVGIAQYTTAELALPAFDRAVATRDFNTYIKAIFVLNAAVSTFVTGTGTGTPFSPITFTVRSVPEQKATPPGSNNLLFYMGVDVDWALISGANAAGYKKSWQFGIAQALNIHPYQVTDIFFVQMSTTTTVGRHATAQAIERVNAHMTICPTKCAPNQPGAGVPPVPATVPPSFSDDDDSSIIAVAVIVPIAVIAIVLVIIYYLMCGGEEKKPEPTNPYGDKDGAGEAAAPDGVDEAIPAGEETA